MQTQTLLHNTKNPKRMHKKMQILQQTINTNIPNTNNNKQNHTTKNTKTMHEIIRNTHTNNIKNNRLNMHTMRTLHIQLQRKNQNMKKIVQIKAKSNDQLHNRLNEINISLRRIKGYNKGACKPPHEILRPNNKEDTMYQHKLKREKAQILTILNERKNKEKNKKIRN